MRTPKRAASAERGRTRGAWFSKEPGFDAEIRAAQQDFPVRFPEMIRPDNTIRDTSFYTQQIATYLIQNYGYCAVPGPGFGEIRVKKSNDFAQHVKVVSSFDTSFIGSVFTCIPASF